MHSLIPSISDLEPKLRAMQNKVGTPSRFRALALELGTLSPEPSVDFRNLPDAAV